MESLPPKQGPAKEQQHHPVRVVIRSWYLARALGVTTTPPEGEAEYIGVKIEGGPPLFWTLLGKPEVIT